MSQRSNPARALRLWQWACVATLVAAAPPAAAPAAPAPPAAAPVRLGLPVLDPAAAWSGVAGYRADRLELELAPAARPRDPGLVRSRARTGAAGVDRLLDRFAVAALEPEFPGAAEAAPGSPEEALAGFYIVHLPPGAPLAEALAAFRAEPGVRSADPVGVYPVEFDPNDSLFALQYAFSQASDRDADLPEAWNLTQGDTSLTLAIVDTGVLWTHPDLGGAPPYTGGSIWHNWAEMGGVAGVDDDANGFVDDFRGWDFVTGVTGRTGEDLSTPDNDPSDFVGHGTMVAGVAGAIVHNVSGVAGAGYRVKVMALRAGWDDGVGPGGKVDMSFCAQAIHYAAKMGATAITCSWSNGNLSGLGAAVTYALAQGATVVVAAGNQGTSNPLANYLGQRGDCVDVAALAADDVRAGFSNYGLWVDICAGGENIISTFSSRYTPMYVGASGTSLAVPLVAGVVGLYQSWRKAHGLGPATPAEVLLRLRDTGDSVDALNPGDEGMLGGGRVNAARMILDPPTSFVKATGGTIYGAPAFVDWGGAAQAVVFGNESRMIWALDGSTGAALPGWPVNAGGAVRTHPAVWDVDFDGVPEAIVGADGGEVHVLRSDGSAVAGWPAALGGTVDAGPAVGDVAGDPAYEIIVGTSEPNALHVLDRSGSELPGWPMLLGAPVYSSPAIANLDGTGKAEIVFGAEDSTVYAVTGEGASLPGWPIKVGGTVTGAAAIGDLDGDGGPDVVVGSSDGVVHAWSAEGVPLAGWPVSLGASILGDPALADADGDSWLEVVVGGENGSLRLWNHDGSAVAGWPASTSGPLRGSPVVADIDVDGQAEIIAGCLDGLVYAFRADGTGAPGWPRSTGGGVTGGGSLGDPDRDGRLELAIGSIDHKLYCWDLGPGTYDASRLPWPTARRSFLRQGTIRLPAIGVGPPGARAGLRLAVSPNPVRLGGEARLVAAGHPGEAVRFSLFDARGRLVRAEEAILDGSGAASWKLAGAAGPRTAAGLYFVVARVGALAAQAKWVVLP